MGKHIKYTRELLESLIKESTSIAQVIRKLGLREAGGTHSHISRKIKEYEIDSSHFLGQAANCGDSHKGGPDKKEWHEILVLRESGRRQDAHRLRRALIESGQEYKCCDCGNRGEWNGQTLRLQVDHKNGNWLDNRRENLAFRCPNCHSQTSGWSGSKGLTDLTSNARYCRELRRRKKRLVTELVDDSDLESGA